MEEKKARWKWSKPTSLYTSEEKNRVMKKLIEVSTNTAFENHFYRWEGRLFRQRKGGGIGLRGTGSLARHATDEFIEILLKNLKNKG